MKRAFDQGFYSMPVVGINVGEGGPGSGAVVLDELQELQGFRLDAEHRAGGVTDEGRFAVEGLVEEVEQGAVGVVEGFLGRADLRVRGAAWVRLHRGDAGEIDRDRFACRAGPRQVTALVAATEFQLLEAVVVSDLVAVRMEDVVIAVPDL